MKITQLTAAALLIASCGLAQADEAPRQQPQPRQPIGRGYPGGGPGYDQGGPGYGPGPGAGYYEGGPGAFGPPVGGPPPTEVIVGGPQVGPPIGIGAPPVAGPAAIIPSNIPFRPELSGGCGISMSRVQPGVFRVSILWRNGAPPYTTREVFGDQGVARRLSELQSCGYCLGNERQPIMKTN